MINEVTSIITKLHNENQSNICNKEITSKEIELKAKTFIQALKCILNDEYNLKSYSKISENIIQYSIQNIKNETLDDIVETSLKTADFVTKQIDIVLETLNNIN